LGVPPDLLLLVVLLARLVDRLGLRRPPLDEPHREQDVEQELEILRLPVLRDVHGELRRREVVAHAHLRQTADGDGAVVLRQPRERLPDERQDKDEPEEQGEAVVAQRFTHTHRWRKPMTKR